jgi:serine O-acetyltransferase
MSGKTMTQTKSAPSGRLQAIDPIWDQMREEAETAMNGEPALGSFIYATVLSHPRLEDAIVHRLSQRLNPKDITTLSQTFHGVLEIDPSLGHVFRADLAAVYDRDPACTRYLEPLLFFKGFHALVTYRFAHALWVQGRKDFAFYLQSASSRTFASDIHPAARLGKGLMLDHATGFVCGETVVVGDNCSFLHAVTLGGSGKEMGDRHPKIGDNVLIGAGAKVLGNIKVGRCSRIAAGSVVLSEVPPNVTVAGVPAKVVGSAGCAEPSRSMDQGWVDDFGGL